MNPRNQQFNLIVFLTLALILLAGCGGEQIGHGGYREGSALPEKAVPVEPSVKEEIPVEVIREIADVGPAPLNLAAALQGQDVVLTWDEVNPGDYNSDGSISGLDVFPLAANFNDDVAGNPGHECIDGNGDGTLNGLDLFIVAANFDTRVDGYNVWSAASDAGPFDTQENGSLVDYIGCSAENTYTDLMPALPRWYVVRSYDSDAAQESADSTVALADSTPDTDPPAWNGTVGAQLATRDGETAWIWWNGATDASSPPVEYIVGYSTSTPLDWDVETSTIVLPNPADGGPDFDFKHGHIIPGLADTDYYFGVRVRDSADPANVDDNTVTVGITDVEPPYWPTTVGAQFAERIGDTAWVYWNAAVDDDSPPVRYVFGYGLTNPLNWSNLEHAFYVPENPSDGGPDYDYKQGALISDWGDTEYYFGIRAEDSPIPGGNRDDNTVSVLPAAGDTAPPVWDDTTGIQQLMTTGQGALLLLWNNATDAQSNPVTYNVYWDTQTPIRFGAGAIKNENVEVTPAGDFDHSYEVVGLLPNTQYWFAVRAQDSADAPNEDQNTDELELTMPEMLTQIIDAGEYGKLYLASVGDEDSDWIFYQNLNNNTLLYATTDNGLTWTLGTVDSTTGAGTNVSAELAPDGNPVLCWHNSWEGTLNYAKWNGASFDTEVVDGGVDQLGRYCDLELDADGDPAISYVDDTNFNLKFAWYDGSAWQIETVDSLGDVFWVVDGTNSLIFADDGLPMIAYRNDETGAIWVAKRGSSVKGGAPGDWNRQQVSSNGEDNRFPRFFRTVHNTLMLAYFVDFVYQVHMYAYVNSVWQLMINHQLSTYIWNLQIAHQTAFLSGTLIQLMVLAVLQDEGPLLLLPLREAFIAGNPILLTYAAIFMGTNVYDADMRIVLLQGQLAFVATVVQNAVLQRIYMPIVTRERN